MSEKHHVTCNCLKCLEYRATLPDAGGCQCNECREKRIEAACEPNILTELRIKQIEEKAKQAEKHQTVLVCFESGHYKKLHGKWKGDTIWTHWIKPNGKTIHINKDKVEYYEEL